MPRPMERRRSRICVLASGGVDSAALVAHYLARGRSVLPAYIAFGYFWEKAELHWLRKLLKAMAAPGLEPLVVLRDRAAEFHPAPSWALTGRRAPGLRSRDETVYLPGRNILLLSKASVLCAREGIGAVALGTLRSNPFPDGQAPFFRLFGRALSAGLGRPLDVLAPFAGLDKRRVIARAGDLPWRYAFSCLSPRGRSACGRCNKCGERRRAFLRDGAPTGGTAPAAGPRGFCGRRRRR